MLSTKRAYWDLVSLVAGTAFTLSFAPFDYHYFSLLALIFLASATVGLRPGRAFLRGYLFGLGQFGLGVSWVFVSVHHFGGAAIIPSILISSLFVAFWALFPGLATFLAAIIPVKSDNFRIAAFSFTWILIEYLRGYWVLNGFPWLQIAYSQMDGPLAGYIPVFGCYGTGLIACATVSILAIFIKSGKQPVLLMGLLAIFWGTGVVLKSVEWTHGIGEPIRVALIQGNISQDQKWQPEYKASTLALYQAMTRQHWNFDVIVWPESAIPAYLDEVEDYFILPLKEEAKRHHTDLIVSAPAHGRSEDEKYNAVITLGKKEGQYRKAHLLPFGEYLPWQPLSGWLLNSLKIKLGSFTPGPARQPLLEAAGRPFITSICYEDVFSERAIVGLPEGAYLVNVTNDGWFGDSIEPHQHMQLARMRAIETGRYLLRATNTGLTGIVAPNGKITKQAPLFETSTLTGEISPMGGMTPYAEVGDGPVIYLIASALCLIVFMEKWIFQKVPH